MSPHESLIAEWGDHLRAGKIGRRAFIQRLTALGLSTSAITAALAAQSAPAAAAPRPADRGLSPAGQDQATTLLIATSETPPGLDTEYYGSRASHEGIGQTMDALVNFGKKKGADGLWYSDFSNLQGALAESWDVAPDGKSVTFHLRKGVMSHWGNELTADDVFYSWNRGYQLKSNRAFYYFFMKIKDPSSIKALDKYTVRFEYEAPSSIAVVMHSNLYLTINDSKATKAHATASDPWARNWLATNAGGYGPYYVETWQPGQQVVFRAHEGYWGGAPAIKEVIVREVPNSANRLALIETGAVDIAQWLLPQELLQLKSNPNVSLANFRSNFHVIYEMNTLKPPFDNPKVREAFKWAFPYDDALTTIFLGTAERQRSLVPSVFPDNTEQYYTYETDLAKAKQALAAAGFPSGFKTELTYNSEINWDEQLAILAQTNLKKIGVDVTLNKLPGEQFFDTEWGKKLTTCFFEDQPNVPAAEYALWAFGNSQSRGDTTSWKNAQYDELTSGALAELDPAKRKTMNYQAQQMVAQDGPYVFIARPMYSLAMRPGITGARWFPAEYVRWDEMTKK